jgi:hypothetical protein
MRSTSLRALVLTTLLFGVRPADACVNVTKADLDESVRNLKIADAALEADDLAKARKWLAPVLTFLSDAKNAIDPKDGMVHGPDRLVVPPPEPGLYRRAARIRALVRARDPKSSAADREAAMKIFEKEVLGASPNPAILADYAEVLSHVPARTAQATMVLRALRDKDLIGSSHAYAALAALEKESGDQAAEAAARDRCRTIAKKPTICG